MSGMGDESLESSGQSDAALWRRAHAAATRTTARMTPAELTEIRTAVAKLCADFPGEYWRALDRDRRYPTEFVRGAHRGGLPLLPDPRAVRRQRARPVLRGAILEEIQASG